MHVLFLPAGRRAITALEFAIVAPIFVLMLVAIMGLGLCGLYELCLDDAVRNAAKQVQIGGPASTNGGAFANAVCAEFGILTRNCAANLTYYVQTVSSPTTTPPTGNFASITPIRLPAGGAFANSFPALSPNNNVLIQAAYPLPMGVPIIGTAMTLTGTNSIMATTTVRMEPYQ